MSDWTSIPEFLTIEPKIRVLLLGSYRDGCLSRLKSIRNEMRKLGLLNTRLSIDFTYPVQSPDEKKEIFNLRASEHWLKISDIQIFIFFKGTDNGSIGIELATHLYDPWKSYSTIVGLYKGCPSLIAGLTLKFEPSLTKFEHSKDKEIISQSIGSVRSRLSQYYNIIYGRTIGNWEIYSKI